MSRRVKNDSFHFLPFFSCWCYGGGKTKKEKKEKEKEKEQKTKKNFVRQMDRANRIYIKDYSLSLLCSPLLVLFSLFSIVLPDRQMCQTRYDGISCIACRCAHWNDIIQISFFFVDQSSTTMSRWSDWTRLESNANVSILGLNQLAMIHLVWFIYHFWMFAQGKERDCRRTPISTFPSLSLF